MAAGRRGRDRTPPMRSAPRRRRAARRLRAHAPRQRLRRRPRRDPRRAVDPRLAGRRRVSSSLQPALRALFCATHSDWQRFDEIFAAYWTGRGIRRGAGCDWLRAGAQPAAATVAAKPGPPGESAGMPDHVERRDDRRRRRSGATAAAAARAPRAPKLLAAADMRHIVDPDDIARTHALAARLAARCARGSSAASRCAAAAAGSTSGAPSTAASRTAARRSTSPGAGAS